MLALPPPPPDALLLLLLMMPMLPLVNEMRAPGLEDAEPVGMGRGDAVSLVLALLVRRCVW